MSPPFSAAIFDLDGTLVDSYEPIAASLNSVRARFGLAPKSVETVRGEVGSGLELLIASNVGEEHVVDGVALFRREYRKIFLAGTRLLPGVAETIAALERAGVGMVVASNKPAYFSREILDHLGLSGRFRAVLGPELVENPKPHPEMVLRAIELLGVAPERILYVGDMVVDIVTCRRAGIAVAVLPTGSEGRDALAAAEPDYLLGGFREVAPLFGAEL
jgi:phosphoglycolate phosphatase